MLAILAGVVAIRETTHRRHPGPLRRAGDRLHRVPRAGAAGGRGPGHLPDHHQDAGGALRQGGARLLVLRLLVRLRDLRGRHRPLLGPHPGPGVPLGPPGQLPAGRRPQLGPDATGVGWAFMYVLNSDRHSLAELRSLPGLVPAIRPDRRRGRRRGRHRRRLRAAVPGRGRSGEAARATTSRCPAVEAAIQRTNSDVGGRLVEMAEREFMVRGPRLHQGASAIWRTSSWAPAPAACRSCSGTSPTSPSARRSAAAWPSGTARARPWAASSWCAPARTP